MVREIETHFESGGLRCDARLALPAGAGAPVVVMAHGFGGERTFGLQPFIARFVAAGLAVFSFDYRNFGGSEGEPRNWVDPRRHLEDWRAAVAHVRSRREVDAGRLALWGTSFSGGHALVTASRDPGVAAVVAQVPFVDGVATALHLRPRDALRGLAHGLVDAGGALLGRKPHLVPLAGSPREYALLNTPDAMAGIESIVDKASAWRNEAPARIALRVPFYRPVSSFPAVRCPVLVLAAENDSLIPIEAVRAAVKRLPRCEYRELPVGHFDVYTGEWFERAVAIEAAFLAQTLGAPGVEI